MEYQTILLEKKNNIATLTLNRPEKLNALNPQMFVELVHAFRKVNQDDDIRVLVITGAGRGFCSGVDLTAQARNHGSSSSTEGKTETEIEGISPSDFPREAPLALAGMKKPVIAAINGVAVGGGLTFTLSCDIRIASETARFSIPLTRLGFTFEPGSSYFLSRIIGIGKAQRFDGSDDYISRAGWDNTDLGNSFTLEAWLKSDDLASTHYLFGMYPWATGAFYIRSGTNSKLSFSTTGGNEAFTASTIQTGSWYHVALVVNGGSAQFYLDGSADGSATTGHNATGTHTFYTGKGHGEDEWDGFIDEARISNVARSADWIATGYNNQSSPSTFYFVGNKEVLTIQTQNITRDVENRPVSITEGENTSTFVYDGDGNRVKKTEGGETILYVNRYYEVNLTTEVVTSSYYLGGRLVAQKAGSTLRYVHQDSLSSTALMSDSSGSLDSSMDFYPFGGTRSGSVNTDQKFTGQRLDTGTGLYYYGARYYDATIGRFISADTLVQSPANPQTLNRYSYVLNNPLRYVDPSGHVVIITDPSLTSFLQQYDITSGGSLYTGDPSAILADWLTLREAYVKLASAAPEMARTLEAAPELINIQWSDEVGGARARAADSSATGNIDILLGSIWKDQDTGIVASVIGHEGFHAVEAINGGISIHHNTAGNEAFAYSFGYQVSIKLGRENDFVALVPLSYEFRDINPYMDKLVLENRIEEARQILYDTPNSNYYRVILNMRPLTRWPGICGMGRGKFLSIAESVWVK